MEAAKLRAIRILSNLGFHAEEIPEGPRRSADLSIRDDASVYHLEVKQKLDSPDVARDHAECYAHCDVYQQKDPIAHSNRISGILRDAQKQLNETVEDAAYNLIWFHASGIDADLKYRQAFATYYGQVPLIARNPTENGITTCFYFDYSAAFAMPTVEALILTDQTTLQVCLNEFAHRSEEFRRTKFCETFCSLDAVIDPIALATQGKIISCRATIPRRNDDEICAALREQTGVLYTTIRLNRYSYSAAVRIPD